MTDATREFVRLEVADGVATMRLDRPKMNALDVQVQEEIRAAAHRGDRARRRQGRRGVGRRARLRRRRGRQGDGRHVLHRHGQALRRAAVGLLRGRADPQAGRGGGQRLRPRRRLRARAVRRHPHRRRRRDPRPAGDPARHHPGRRRHPAADPPRRAQPGQGPRSSRAGSSRPTRRWPSASSTGWSRPPRCTTPPWPGRASSAAAASYAVRAAKESIDRGIEVDLETGLEIERQQFAALFATEDRAIGMRSFVEQGPGKAAFVAR